MIKILKRTCFLVFTLVFTIGLLDFPVSADVFIVTDRSPATSPVTTETTTIPTAPNQNGTPGVTAGLWRIEKENPDLPPTVPGDNTTYIGIKSGAEFKYRVSNNWTEFVQMTSIWINLPSVDEGGKVKLMAPNKTVSYDENVDKPILLENGQVKVYNVEQGEYIAIPDVLMNAGEWYRIERITDHTDPYYHLTQVFVYKYDESQEKEVLLGASDLVCTGIGGLGNIGFYCSQVIGYGEGEEVKIADFYAQIMPRTVNLSIEEDVPTELKTNKFVYVPSPSGLPSGTANPSFSIISHFIDNRDFSSKNPDRAPIGQHHLLYELRLRIPSGDDVTPPNIRLFDLISGTGLGSGLVSVYGVQNEDGTEEISVYTRNAQEYSDSKLNHGTKVEGINLERDKWYTFRLEYAHTPADELEGILEENKATLTIKDENGNLLGEAVTFDCIKLYTTATTVSMLLAALHSGTTAASPVGERPKSCGIHIDDTRVIASSHGYWAEAENYEGVKEWTSSDPARKVAIILNDDFQDGIMGGTYYPHRIYNLENQNFPDSAISREDYRAIITSDALIGGVRQLDSLELEPVIVKNVVCSLKNGNDGRKPTLKYDYEFDEDSIEGNIVLCEVLDDGSYEVASDYYNIEYFPGSPTAPPSITVTFGTLEPGTTYELQFRRGLKIKDDNGILLDPIHQEYIAYRFRTPAGSSEAVMDVSNIKFFDDDGNEILTNTLSNTSKVKASADLSVTGEGADKNYTLILAVYNEDGTSLVAVAAESGTLAPGEEDTVETELIDLADYDLPDGNYTAKIFVWNTWTQMSPYTEGTKLGGE